MEDCNPDAEPLRPMASFPLRSSFPHDVFTATYPALGKCSQTIQRVRWSWKASMGMNLHRQHRIYTTTSTLASLPSPLYDGTQCAVWGTIFCWGPSRLEHMADAAHSVPSPVESISGGHRSLLYDSSPAMACLQVRHALAARVRDSRPRNVSMLGKKKP